MGREQAMKHDEMRRMIENKQAEDAEDSAKRQELKLAFFREVGGLKRSGVFDATGCPKCGEKALAKNYCQGREEREGLEAGCIVLGDHMHAKCGTCAYVWLERCKDDHADLDNRGGLRYDEMLVDGKLVSVSVPDAGFLWGILTPQEEAQLSELQHMRDETFRVGEIEGA